MGKARTVCRSAESGRFVKPGYATQHPKTTVRERIHITKSGKKSK